VAGFAAAGSVLLLLADGAEASSEGEPAGWVPWLTLALAGDAISGLS
jgi:hypothetical protein